MLQKRAAHGCTNLHIRQAVARCTICTVVPPQLTRSLTSRKPRTRGLLLYSSIAFLAGTPHQTVLSFALCRSLHGPNSSRCRDADAPQSVPIIHGLTVKYTFYLVLCVALRET